MTVRIFACGDVVNSKDRSDFLDNELESVIQSCDLSICNFEAPIKHKGIKPIKKAGPHIYQSKNSITYLKESGFSFVSLANNHIYDYGLDGLGNTICELKRQKIRFVGGGVCFKEAYKTQVVEKKGIRIGFIAACENEFGCLYEEQNRGGYAWLFHHCIEDNIRELKTKCDFVVMIAHAGIENIDFPIKEWRDRYKRLCDVGVDVVIGHHPHVPQGHEIYKDSIIFYSLGNFYFDSGGFANSSDDSYSVVLELEKKGIKGFQIIYHKKVNGKTSLASQEDVSFSLSELNSLLEEGYNKLNNEIAIKLFSDYYKGYYQIAMGIPNSKNELLKIIKYLILKLLYRNRDIDKRNLMLLHNIRIDSHRFVVQRALSLLSERT